MRKILLIAIASLAAVTFSPTAAIADSPFDPIQPGDQVNGNCTLNFVFDGIGINAGKVYIGTAAHCINNIGQIGSTAGNTNFGFIAYQGDVGASVNGGAARDNGIPGEQLDFSLFEVRPAFVHHVLPWVRGHPNSPSGFTTTADTTLGDGVKFSGYGMGVSVTASAREKREGIFWSDTTRDYVVEGPVIFGDSGGPVMMANGKALGTVSGTTIGIQVPPTKFHGPTIEGILAELNSPLVNFPVALRTV